MPGTALSARGILPGERTGIWLAPRLDVCTGDGERDDMLSVSTSLSGTDEAAPLRGKDQLLIELSPFVFAAPGFGIPEGFAIPEAGSFR